jgi:hypothetical protein
LTKHETRQVAKRQNSLISGVSASSMQDHSITSTGHSETLRDTKSHQAATKNATALLPEDPDFAMVAGAWDRLPAAIRQGILAMVKAAVTTDK